MSDSRELLAADGSSQRISHDAARKALHADYIYRIAGKSPVVEFKTYRQADIWLREGLLVQPYHYKSYQGEPFDRAAEIAWLQKLPDRRAYYWALTGRDIELVRACVKRSKTAFEWALNIGDRDIMRDRVIESKWAYHWALHIGDRDIMRDRVIESEWAYEWARNFGDYDLMRKYVVVDPEWALRWGLFLGDKDLTLEHAIRNVREIIQNTVPNTRHKMIPEWLQSYLGLPDNIE